MTGYAGWGRAAYRPAWSPLTPENKLNGRTDSYRLAFA